MNERTKLITEIFLNTLGRHSNSAQKLQTGLFLRQQFHQTINQGIVPNHPRFEWIRIQSRILLESVLSMSKDYTKSNPNSNDKISMADLSDIIGMTQNVINDAIKNGIIDPDEVKLISFKDVKTEIK